LTAWSVSLPGSGSAPIGSAPRRGSGLRGLAAQAHGVSTRLMSRGSLEVNSGSAILVRQTLFYSSWPMMLRNDPTCQEQRGRGLTCLRGVAAPADCARARQDHEPVDDLVEVTRARLGLLDRCVRLLDKGRVVLGQRATKKDLALPNASGEVRRVCCSDRLNPPPEATFSLAIDRPIGASFGK
jgi:hypothetical protein